MWPEVLRNKQKRLEVGCAGPDHRFLGGSADPAARICVNHTQALNVKDALQKRLEMPNTSIFCFKLSIRDRQKLGNLWKTPP